MTNKLAKNQPKIACLTQKQIFMEKNFERKILKTEYKIV